MWTIVQFAHIWFSLWNGEVWWTHDTLDDALAAQIRWWAGC